MEKYTLKRITIEEIPEPSMRLFDPEVDAVAIKAIEAVRSGGETALRRWVQEFDGLAEGAPLVIAREEMKAAYDSLPEETAALLGRAKGRVAAFAAAQRACLAPLDVPALGGRHGHEFVPV
ncbi:MAG: histidinol dehydrogenase, partial [Rectinema subterraneum]|uniref:histidinol dehydrogenase n=1 Tax=Rectinema subterraneum TaxID=2653714 RepID=UPI003C7E9780